MNANKQDAGGLPSSCGPADTLDDKTLVAVALQCAGRSAMYQTEVLFNRVKECEAELLSRLERRNGEQCRAASGSDRDYTTDERAQIVNEFYLTMLDLRGMVTEEQERRLLRAGLLLRALSRGVPEGMVLVPVEPTQKMLDAFCELEPDKITEFHYYGGLTGYDHYTTEEGAKLAWSTMLAAIAAQRKEGD